MDSAPTVTTETIQSYKSCYLGIDPGKMGGIAVISDEECILALKMPKTGKEILENLQHILTEVNILHCCIEKLHALPAIFRGSISNFELGFSCGQLTAFLIACDIRYEEVSPQKWQKYLQCLSKGDKNVLRAKAESLFPKALVNLYVADALLLAAYARSVYKEKI